MRQKQLTVWLSVYLLISQLNSHASDTAIATQLLQRINALQSPENGVFPKGLFPSYRTYALNKDRQKADVNIFFTGLIIFTLNNLQQNLTPYQKQLSQQIINNALPVAKKFKNKKGRDTYNFWPTDTPQIFPNSGWMNWFDKSQALPDDLDDTVIMLMALKANKATAAAVHELMQQFANNGSKQVNNTFKGYRNIPAYSTWFGKKMPIDFDVSVLSNILYFVKYYNLPFTHADSASLQLIERVIKEQKHLTAAGYVSPHYRSPVIIMYHLSRLMQLSTILQLEKYKVELIEQSKKLLASADNFMEAILLQSSLLRWGVNVNSPKSFTANSLTALVEEEDFSFFIANMASILPDQLKKAAGAASVGKFTYYCPAYNYVLLLENLVLLNSHQQAVSSH